MRWKREQYEKHRAVRALLRGVNTHPPDPLLGLHDLGSERFWVTDGYTVLVYGAGPEALPDRLHYISLDGCRDFPYDLGKNSRLRAFLVGAREVASRLSRGDGVCMVRDPLAWRFQPDEPPEEELLLQYVTQQDDKYFVDLGAYLISARRLLDLIDFCSQDGRQPIRYKVVLNGGTPHMAIVGVGTYAWGVLALIRVLD